MLTETMTANPTIEDLMARIEKTIDQKIQSNVVARDYALFAPEAIKKAIERDRGSAALDMILSCDGYIDPVAATYAKTSVERRMLKDLITSEEFAEFFPKVVTKRFVEAIEPNLVLTNMLQKMTFTGLRMKWPFLSGFGGNLSMGEGAEPRAFKMTTGSYQEIEIGKHGIAVEVTEETLMYNEFPVWNHMINESLKALARWKEVQVSEMLFQNAKVALDNDSEEPTMHTSGVDASGTANGGLTFDDIIVAASKLITKGFSPNTIIVHPLSYPVFLTNPTLRGLFLFTQGRMGSWYNKAGVTFKNTIDPYLGEFQYPTAGRQIAGINFPSLFGVDFNVVLSPFAPFNPTENTVDLIIADSAALGLLVVNQLPTTSDYDDKYRDIRKTKIIERYAVAPAYKGDGMSLIKGITLKKSYEKFPTLIPNP
ncbi:MAG TPA: hypothetical protein P5539_14420 [Mesotoga sp.]|nr:hypothetical protein [Mesotoga sp.]